MTTVDNLRIDLWLFKSGQNRLFLWLDPFVAIPGCQEDLALCFGQEIQRISRPVRRSC